jgi:serine protease Do
VTAAALLLAWFVPAILSPPAAAQEDRDQVVTFSSLSNELRRLTDTVSPAVVQIFTSSFGPLVQHSGQGAAVFGKQIGSGSGAIIDPAGYIVTNAHVVEGARRVQVLLSPRINGRETRSILAGEGRLVGAQIIGVDQETDLALLKIPEQGLPHLEFGNSDELFQGQMVFAFGSPLGLSNSVSFGVVSTVARQLERESPMIYLQHDAAVNPGNSGGPLINSRGQIVGVNTLIFTQSGGFEGLSFAAPSNIVRVVVEQLRATGRVRRGIIGVRTQTIDPWLAEGLGLPQDWGVILGDVYPGSPAAAAGLEIGDIVLTLDGKKLENGRQCDVNIYGKKIGGEVQLEILRGGRRLTRKVKVVERVEPNMRFLSMVTPERNLIPRIGVLVLDLDAQIRRMLPDLRRTEGVVVAARAADAQVFGESLEPGDVIYAVNGQAVPDLRSLRQRLDGLGFGEVAVLQLERAGTLRYLTMELE